MYKFHSISINVSTISYIKDNFFNHLFSTIYKVLNFKAYKHHIAYIFSSFLKVV